MNMVCSRPIVSETQPKKGRPNPSKMRSSEIAKVSAAIWKPASVTGVLAMLKSCAIGPICAAVIRPPEATMTKTRYITQKTGLRSTCGGVKSIWVCGRLSRFFFRGGEMSGGVVEEGGRERVTPRPLAKGEKAVLGAAAAN